MKTHYVTGFMFSENRLRVALIRKRKPEWQRGLLNGIGGKIEPGEDGPTAIAREFVEETSCKTLTELWKPFCTMDGKNDEGSHFRVEFFACFGDVDQVKTTEEEKIEITDLDTIFPGRPDVVENLPRLVALALDHLKHGRPTAVRAIYK